MKTNIKAKQIIMSVLMVGVVGSADRATEGSI